MSTYVIPAARLTAAQKAVDKINTKAAKAGITGRYTLEVSDPYVKTENGKSFHVHNVTLKGSPLKYDDWEFAAKVDAQESYTVVNCVPGVSVPDMDLIDGHNCDHCKSNRNRRVSYILHNTVSSEYIQVGSACMSKFLGFSPALWFLEFTDKMPSYTSGLNYSDFLFSTRTVIAHALSVSSRGHDYVKSGSGLSTINATLNSINDMNDVTSEYPLADTVIASVLDMNLYGDYGYKLGSILCSEYVSFDSFGIVVSAVKVWADNERKKVDKITIEESYVDAPVGGSVENHKVKIIGMKVFPGEYGPKTLVDMIDQDNRSVVWWASKHSSDINASVGDDILITKAKVKKKGVYKESFQTVLSHVKFAI